MEKKYNGWIVSNNIIKRAFAVYLHFALAHIIVLLFFVVFAVIISFLIGILL